MKHRSRLLCLALTWFAASAGSPQFGFAGDSTPKKEGDSASICRIFDLSTFYKGEKVDFLQSLAAVGRINVDAVFFHEAPDREFDALLWRRIYDGFEAKFRGGVTLHAEAEFDFNEQDPLYSRLSEVYLGWSPSKELDIKIGKQSASFTLDGKTSSRMLIRPERSLLSYNLWFPDNFHSGIAAAGTANGWVYNAGFFSSSGGNEFGDFDAGFFGLLSIGRDVGKRVGLDKALIALDYVHNRPDAGNFGTRSLANIVSLNGRFEQGKFGVWTDMAIGDGYLGQSDLFGLELMPFYNLTKKVQIVASYNYVKSEDPNGVRLDRYENSIESRRSDHVHEFFGGVNYYVCGHKLKWQNGVEYTTASDTANDGGQYNGWGYTSAFRMYW